MLNEQEKSFLEYWEKNRDKQRKFFKQLAIGLPLGTLFAIAIFINIASGWYTRAASVINTNPSFILVMIVAVLFIVVFISVYSVKHRWDMNEQRYRELGGTKPYDPIK